MRNLEQLQKYVVENPFGIFMRQLLENTLKDDPGKADAIANIPTTYQIPHNVDSNLVYWVLCSNCYGWEHVSVSLRNLSNEPIERCPTWDEMCYIKSLFFKLEEYAMQFHPPLSKYVNNYSYVLHLWRPTDIAFPVPPVNLV